MKVHRTWEDILTKDALVDQIQPEVDVQQGNLPQPDGIELPPELDALLAKKEEIEQELRTLAGEEPQPELSERDRLRFPVKVHTKQSRIEDRTTARSEERQRFLKLRRLQLKTVERRREDSALELNQQHKQKKLQDLQLRLKRQAAAEELVRYLKMRSEAEQSMKARLDRRIKLASLQHVRKTRTERTRLEARLETQKDQKEKTAARKKAHERQLQASMERQEQAKLMRARILLEDVEHLERSLLQRRALIEARRENEVKETRREMRQLESCNALSADRNNQQLLEINESRARRDLIARNLREARKQRRYEAMLTRKREQAALEKRLDTR
jgi:hypothetical protein